MKEAHIQVMNLKEDWERMFSDGWEYVTTMKNGYSVFQRERVEVLRQIDVEYKAMKPKKSPKKPAKPKRK